MAAGDRKDPYGAFNFVVKIKGKKVGGFSEVNGLQAEVEVHEYREGGQNNYIHRLPGPVRYPNNLVLKHGITDADVLWKWYQDVAKGPVAKQRKNVTIELQDSAGTTKWTWNLKEAYPVKWVGPDLRGTASEVAVETLELVHRGITKG